MSGSVETWAGSILSAIHAGIEAFDYRCPNGHVFAAPPAEHGGPWATLVCDTCGCTAVREFAQAELDLQALAGVAALAGGGAK